MGHRRRTPNQRQIGGRVLRVRNEPFKISRVPWLITMFGVGAVIVHHRWIDDRDAVAPTVTRILRIGKGRRTRRVSPLLKARGEDQRVACANGQSRGVVGP